jgi:PPOX class probable F420-dependent enzyme
MDIDQARDFLRQNHRAVLATRRSDGGVQMSPIVLALDEDGTVVISSRETAIKVKNLQRDPYAYAIVLNDRFYGDWIQVEGPVTIEPLPGAMEGLVRYYRTISGEHPDWEDYRQAMVRDRRVIVRMEITRAGPTISG